MQTYDVVVVGAGIAGLSAAAALARDLRVLVCEAEAGSDRHSTGRSAAAFIASYGNATVRTLNAASRAWFDSRADGWSEHALLHPRPALWIGDPGSAGAVKSFAAELAAGGASVERVTALETGRLCPVIVEDWREHSLLDPSACDIDVSAAMAALRRSFTALGGELRLNAQVRGLRRRDDAWTVALPDAEVSCAVVVNAAGAWADGTAVLAGLPPLGLTPMRRTIAACGLDPTHPSAWSWPLVLDARDTFYFKPERAQVLLSPADETPSPACDVRPDPLDVANALERVNAATTLALRSVRTSWAGLRTFAADRTPVVGRDPEESSFVWAAGQGGYGITISPAVAELVAAAVTGRAAPPELARVAGHLGPARLRVA